MSEIPPERVGRAGDFEDFIIVVQKGGAAIRLKKKEVTPENVNPPGLDPWQSQ